MVPHTTLFGQQYERDAARHWQRWYRERDSESIITLLSTLLQANITTEISNDRRHIRLCLSPTPYRPEQDAAYQTYIVRVVRWLLPFWHEIGAISVVFCQAWTGTIFYNAGFNSRSYQRCVLA